MKRHLLLLALLLFSSGLWAKNETIHQKHQAIGFNYQYYVFGEGYGAGFQSIGIRHSGIGGNKLYARPTIAAGIGTHSEYDENGSVYRSPLTQISAGCILGVNRKYAGLKLCNEVGALRTGENNRTSFLTMHRLTLNSGYALKQIELAISLPFHIVTVEGLPGLGLLDIGLNYKF